MATSDGDVIMTDDRTAADMAATNTATEGEQSASSSFSATSTSQPTRTDHDRQFYFLPKQPLKRSRPHVTQNLISDYGLDAVHNRVRRVDPVTGEKINKLRKSYVGIVKNLHLAGSNKEVPTPGQWIDTVNPYDPQGIMDKQTVETGFDVVDGQQVPRYEERWKVDIKPVSKQAAQALLGKLGTAMQMAPGPLPDGEKWRKLLGDDETKKKLVTPVSSSLKAPGAAVSAKPSPRLNPTSGRVQRAGAKRNYDESSFAGYNDTFDDVERASSVMAKKARKDVSMSQPLGQSPYNVGLMAGGARQR
ncbi:uncharacterized protein PV09_02484 [Verruconis gallopava]|uniref:Mediator of RNA polymerase II transcription subunit 19 n=1 Tax=Verruconis gallopava TaxID=253628 RepID=A0A0D2B6E0_9PEZI|nr:uncharacterized protein PV09_02484 [Verruconis gallopava]KIW06804.1 hypothetical protein PV09_02484 [Verruconis gallopava]